MSRNSSIVLFLLLPIFALANDCTLTVSGYVKDADTGTPITYANIFLQETEKGVITDAEGYFQLQGICASEYHLNISHVGCAAQQFLLL